MCIICLELLKHRMNLQEADRACKELYRSDKSKHLKKLKEALEEFDLEKLGEALDEGKE